MEKQQERFSKQNKLVTHAASKQILEQLQGDTSYEYVEFPAISGDPNQVRTMIASKHQNTDHVHRWEFAFFVNKQKQELKGLVYFGNHLEGKNNLLLQLLGPDQAVHGGALATILDAAGALNMYRNNIMAVTANMNMNYKAFMPLETHALVSSQILKRDGKKITCKQILTSLDGKVVYAEAESLWIEISAEKLASMKQLYGVKSKL